jgi:hypothetical protein
MKLDKDEFYIQTIMLNTIHNFVIDRFLYLNKIS